jgi:hypothetical protein
VEIVARCLFWIGKEFEVIWLNVKEKLWKSDINWGYDSR